MERYNYVVKVCLTNWFCRPESCPQPGLKRRRLKNRRDQVPGPAARGPSNHQDNPETGWTGAVACAKRIANRVVKYTNTTEPSYFAPPRDPPHDTY